jgi:spermidine synthase
MGTYVPLYGSYWGFAVASDEIDPLAIEPAEVERRIEAQGLHSLSYYNGDTHRALFALPNYFRRIVS